VHKKDNLTVEWRLLLNEAIEFLYCSPNIVRVIKLEIMRQDRHVVCRSIGEAYWGSAWRNLKERGHLVDPDVEGSKTLRWIVRKWVVGAWTRLM
jgi:hypothetical protein